MIGIDSHGWIQLELAALRARANVRNPGAYEGLSALADEFLKLGRETRAEEDRLKKETQNAN